MSVPQEIQSLTGSICMSIYESDFSSSMATSDDGNDAEELSGSRGKVQDEWLDGDTAVLLSGGKILGVSQGE